MDNIINKCLIYSLHILCSMWYWHELCGLQRSVEDLGDRISRGNLKIFRSSMFEIDHEHDGLFIFKIHRYLGLNRISFCLFGTDLEKPKSLEQSGRGFFVQGGIIRPPKDLQEGCVTCRAQTVSMSSTAPKVSTMSFCVLKWHHRGQGDRQLAMQLEIVASKLAL